MKHLTKLSKASFGCSKSPIYCASWKTKVDKVVMSASHPSNEEIGFSPFHTLPSHNEKVSSFLSPLNEVMSPCSVEPSSPPFEVTNADSSMNDEIEMEADFSGEDNAKKKSDNDLVLWDINCTFGIGIEMIFLV